MTARRRHRILFVAAHDSLGGAARAVHRLFESIQSEMGNQVDIALRVIHKTHDDPAIIGGRPSRSRGQYLTYFARTRFRKYFPRQQTIRDNPALHSQALYHSGLGREINKSSPDAIMLGWLGSATLSIEEIGKLAAPVVWRLSDMWMFCGAEHYTPHSRYELGYSRTSRPPSESGPDINRETFLRKRRHWRNPRHVICPSNWMADQVRRSALTKDWPVHVIPNPLDMEKWAPVRRSAARKKLGLPRSDVIVMFGAGGGTRDHHKGPDLFFEALDRLRFMFSTRGDQRGIRGVIFGEEGAESSVNGVPLVFLGRLNDRELALAYSAANVMVVPSRIDNLPSTAVEAQACGTPVAAFRIGGLPDIVEDTVTGRLAEPLDGEDLARAISWIVENPSRERAIGRAARKRALSLWDPSAIAKQYVEVLVQASRTRTGVI